jgi:hypothetical protein
MAAMSPSSRARQASGWNSSIEIAVLLSVAEKSFRHLFTVDRKTRITPGRVTR